MPDTSPVLDTFPDAALLARLRPYVEWHPNGVYIYHTEEHGTGDTRIYPHGVVYNSRITWKYGDQHKDRYAVWHVSSGTHYGGLGSVHARPSHSSELWLVEVQHRPDSYKIIAGYRAGRAYRRIYPDVLALCQALNSEKRD